MEKPVDQVSSPVFEPVSTSAGKIVPLSTAEDTKINWLLIILASVGCGLIIALLILFRENQALKKLKPIALAPTASTYEECTQLEGAVIQESYPAKCIAPNGGSFTQEIEGMSQPDATPIEGWQTYTSPSDSYTFQYPEGLVEDTAAGGPGIETIRWKYIGPTQAASGRTQTELSDGYIFTVTKYGPVAEFDPQTESEKERQNEEPNCSELTEVTTVTVAGTTGYQFSGNCAMHYTSTYFSDGATTYGITQMYVGDASIDYKSTTDQMRQSFKFGAVMESEATEVAE